MGTETALYLLAAGTALSAGASIKSGYDQKAIADANARQAEQDAAAERGAAAVRADQIRKAARMQRSKATGAAAVSGVRIGEGSAGDAESYVTQTGEYDALSEIISGNYRGQRSQQQAGIDRMTGKSAVTSGWLQGGGTLLGNYGRMKVGGWGKAPVTQTSLNTTW